MNNRANLAGLLALVVLSACWYIWLATHNPQLGFAPDDVVYLLMADLYSPWPPVFDAAHGFVRHYAQFPPLFPMILALARGGTGAIVPARIVVALSFVMASVLYGYWLRVKGVPPWTALALAVFSGWWPVNWIMATDLWSEGLYLCVCWLVLLAFHQTYRTDKTWRWALMVGALAATAMATRSIGVAFLPVLFFGLARKGVVEIFLALLAWLVTHWVFTHYSVGGGESYVGELARYYSSSPWAALAGQIAKFQDELGPAAVYDFFLWRSMTDWQFAVALLVSGLGALGAVREIRTGSPSVFYCAIYLAIVLLWPFPSELSRFLVPLLPFALFLVWRGVSVRSQREWPGLLMVGVLVIVTAPAVWACLQRVWTPLPSAELDRWRFTRYWLDASRGPQEDVVENIAHLEGYQRAAKQIADFVPLSECVYTPQIHLVLWHARRASFIPPKAPIIEDNAKLVCHWFQAVGETSAGTPEFYPIQVRPDLRLVVAWTASGQRVSGGQTQATNLLLRLP
jgi:hypothetical protein